jgi:hypothetical protein
VDVDLVHRSDVPELRSRGAVHPLPTHRASPLLRDLFLRSPDQVRTFAQSVSLFDAPLQHIDDSALLNTFERLIAQNELVAVAAPGSGPGQRPAVTIELVTPGPDFSISDQPVMPTIKVRLTGPALPPARNPRDPLPPSPPTPVVCDWTVKLALDCRGVPHGPQRTISHPDVMVRTTTPELTIPFTQIRGGMLSVKVALKVGTHDPVVTAELSAVTGKPLRVLGTNPSKAQLHAAIPTRALRLIIQTESGCRQFANGLPLFSQDNLGGVGLLQITRPTPSDDEVWDWRANVRAAVALFDEKLATARAFARQVRTSPNFDVLVNRYNGVRDKAGKAPLKLTLPAFTEDQVERDAVRGYNGYAGTDYFLGSKHPHEYRVRLDNPDNPLPNLIVREGPNGTGTLEWERSPTGLRPGVAGPYVDDVLSH